jgi:hypothetical protein
MIKSVIKQSRIIVLLAFCAVSSGVCITAENEKLYFEFTENGMLTRVFNRITKQDYLSGDAQNIVRVYGMSGKTISPLVLMFDSLFVTPLPWGSALTFNYKTPDGVSATVIIRVFNNNPESGWDIIVENNSDIEIAEVSFPIFDNIRIGDTAEDDEVVVPARNFSSGSPVRLTYPAETGMLWADVYDKSGSGLYVAGYDKECQLGYVALTSTAGLCIELGKYVHINKGQKWSCRFGIGVHKGDWRWAADRYRSWIITVDGKQAVPRWLNDYVWQKKFYGKYIIPDIVIPDKFDEVVMYMFSLIR